MTEPENRGGADSTAVGRKWDPYVSRLDKRNARNKYLGCWLICPASLASGIAPHAIEVFEAGTKRLWRGATCRDCGCQVNSFGTLWALDSDGHALVSATEDRARFLCEVLAAAKAIISAPDRASAVAQGEILRLMLEETLGAE